MAVCLAIAIHTMFVRHFRYTSICAKCRPMEPRGGNEPPHVHGVTGRRRRFCYSTRHIFGYLIQVLIRIINAKFQTIPLRSSFCFALKAK